MAEETKDRGESFAAIGILLMVIYLAVWFSSPRNSISARSPKVAAMSQVKNLSLASRAYAADREGRYPDKLSDLYPDYLDEANLLIARDGAGARSGFLYHRNLTDTSNSRLPLIQHPFLFDGERITGRVGGHVIMEKVKP